MRLGTFNRPVTAIYSCQPSETAEYCAADASEVVDEGLYGHVCAVVGDSERKGFCHIVTQYGYEGCVQKEAVRFGQAQEGRRMWVVRAYADIMAAPSVKAGRLISLTRGAIVRLQEEKSNDYDGYSKILLNDGTCGYIRSAYLGVYTPPVNGDAAVQYIRRGSADIAKVPKGSIDEKCFRKAVVRTAAQYIGTQYRWGGKTPLGIDCSGLAFMSYMLNGVLIFRDARIEEGYPVKRVALADMKPGDLIYFPGHTAIYAGCGAYIHATARSGSDGVVVNSLNPHKCGYRADLAERITAVGSIFA